MKLTYFLDFTKLTILTVNLVLYSCGNTNRELINSEIAKEIQDKFQSSSLTTDQKCEEPADSIRFCYNDNAVAEGNIRIRIYRGNNDPCFAAQPFQFIDKREKLLSINGDPPTDEVKNCSNLTAGNIFRLNSTTQFVQIDIITFTGLFGAPEWRTTKTIKIPNKKEVIIERVWNHVSR